MAGIIGGTVLLSPARQYASSVDCREALDRNRPVIKMNELVRTSTDQLPSGQSMYGSEAVVRGMPKTGECRMVTPNLVSWSRTSR